MQLLAMSSLELFSSQSLHSKSMISSNIDRALAYHRLPPAKRTGEDSGQSKNSPVYSGNDCSSPCLAWEINQDQSGEHDVTTWIRGKKEHRGEGPVYIAKQRKPPDEPLLEDCSLHGWSFGSGATSLGASRGEHIQQTE